MHKNSVKIIPIVNITIDPSRQAPDVIGQISFDKTKG
jgi:hypothetical protein